VILENRVDSIDTKSKEDKDLKVYTEELVKNKIIKGTSVEISEDTLKKLIDNLPKF